MEANKVIHAFYTDDEVLVDAVKAVKAEHHHIEEVFCPFPVHGLDKAMGLAPTRLAITAFFYGITGLSVGSDASKLKMLSMYEHFKLATTIDNYDGYTRIIYVNGNEGLEYAAVSKRISEYIGMEEHFPDLMKQEHFKQCIYVEDHELNTKEAVKKACTKIYQKQSVGTCSIS